MLADNVLNADTLGAQLDLASPAEPVCDDAVDGIEAEAGAALVAPGGEERIQRLPPDPSVGST